MYFKAFCFNSFLLTALTSTVMAECLPNWKPDNLLPRSCLVALASQSDKNKLTIQMMLKGSWAEREIELPGLGVTEFRRSFTRLGGLPDPELTDRVVAFLSLRHGRPSIVLNGIFRLAADGKVLGYAQDLNPGPYELQPDPIYRSLDALLDEIEVAKADVSQRQSALMKQLASAKNDDTFRQTLHELDEITTIGDTRVYRFIADLMGNSNRGRRCLYFLRNIPDPKIFPLLKDYYKQTGSIIVLDAIGEQGSPEALPFLRQVALEGAKNEKGQFASYGLMSLYLSFERRGMTVESHKVRDVLYELFDEHPFFKEFIKSEPRVLSVMPYIGSISRLQEALKLVQVAGSASQLQNVQSALNACRQKIAKNANSEILISVGFLERFFLCKTVLLAKLR